MEGGVNPMGSATIEIFARLQRCFEYNWNNIRSATIEIFARLQLSNVIHQ